MAGCYLRAHIRFGSIARLNIKKIVLNISTFSFLMLKISSLVVLNFICWHCRDVTLVVVVIRKDIKLGEIRK